MSAKDKVIEAARRVISEKFSQIKARNNRMVGVQADDGEKCFVVHSDAIFELENALAAYDKRRADMKAAVALGG